MGRSHFFCSLSLNKSTNRHQRVSYSRPSPIADSSAYPALKPHSETLASPASQTRSVTVVLARAKSQNLRKITTRQKSFTCRRRHPPTILPLGSEINSGLLAPQTAIPTSPKNVSYQNYRHDMSDSSSY
jgi:hypothetical protein